MNKDQLIVEFEKVLKEKDPSKAIRSIASRFGKYLREETKFLIKIEEEKRPVTNSERMFCLQNNIDSIDKFPKCIICGNYASFKNIIEGYKEVCGLKCSGKRNVLREKEKNGGKYRFQTKEFQEKSIETCQEKYGVNNAFQCEEFKEKQKNTMIELYGVENCSELEDIKNKKIETSREHYGTDYPWQTEEGKLKQKEGVQLKHGVDNVSQLNDVKIKKEQTSMMNWGVRNPSQNYDIRCRILNSSGEDYILPSGNKILIDGRVEKIIFDYLFSIYDESEIYSQPDLPIDYLDHDNVNHVWFPDVFISKTNEIIEIKHISTIGLEPELHDKFHGKTGDKNIVLYILKEFKSKTQYDIYKLSLMNKEEYLWKCEFCKSSEEYNKSRHIKVEQDYIKYGFNCLQITNGDTE